MIADTNPTVTVGLPVFNGARFVGQAIDSLLAQTGVDLELIVSDNGSTDDTESICRAAAAMDDRVTYIRQAENRGAAWNYNELVRRARGRYFKWAAHDDLCAPTFLQECVSAMEADPGIVLSYPRAIDVDETGAAIRDYPSLTYAEQDRPVRRAWSALQNFTPCFESFGVVRTDALRDTQMIGAYASSDRTLFFELALRGRFHEVPAVLFFHRQHPDRSVFHRGGTRGRDSWFDPQRTLTHTSPRWRMAVQHVHAVRAAPISRHERALVYAMLTRLFVRYARPLASESVEWMRARVGARWRRPTEQRAPRPQSS